MKHRSIYLLLVLTTLFWGANFNLGKYVLAFMSPLAAASWRFALASVLMLAYLWFKEGVDWAGIRRNLVPLGVMALVGIFGFNVCFFYGLQTTSSVNGALIMTLNPTLTVLLAALVVGEAISWRQVLGLGLSMAGVVIVVTGGKWQALTGLGVATGDGLLLLGNLCWAVYSVIGKRAVKGLSPIQTTSVTMVLGALAIGALSVMVSPDTLRLPPAPSLAALGAMALFGTVLAYLWWNDGLRTIGPARTSVFIDLVPIFTMLIAMALGEHVMLSQWVGAVLVTSGVLFSSGGLDALLRAPVARGAHS
jgi:drug/metabolite transporter (DMT)-like permease